MIDGVEVSVTTSKIISDDEKKDEEMRFLRWVADARDDDLGVFLSNNCS